MGEILRVPGAPPPFAHLIVPEFFEGGVLAERRRLLAADGWFTAD